MYRFLFLLTIHVIFIADTSAQEKIFDLKSVIGFSRDNEASGYFLPATSGYVINQQIGRHIHRTLYDSTLKPVATYSYKTSQITFNRKHTMTPVFAFELLTGTDIYEVYSDRNTIVVARIDFTNKRDTIVYTLQLSAFEQEEKRLAVMPFSEGIRVLTFSQKKNMLSLYRWQVEKVVDTMNIPLPKSTLSEEEVKLYTKEIRIKYKVAFVNMTVSPADKETVIGQAGTNGIYYTEKKIWLLSQTAFFTGYNIIELDLETSRLHSSNIMLNDMRANNTAHYTKIMKPYAMVVHDRLLIRNSSFYTFQYHLYDMASKKKLRMFEAESDSSLRSLIHSDFNQKGTWFSGNDEKTLDNERAYLRKLNSGPGFISVSNIEEDSITLTTGSLILTNGFGGMLLSIGTGIMGYMANITIGRFQIIPYLDYYRNKLIYCHSKFSWSSFEPSASRQVRTSLDGLIDNFDKKDLQSASSFILKKNNELYIAVFDGQSRDFQFFRI